MFVLKTEITEISEGNATVLLFLVTFLNLVTVAAITRGDPHLVSSAEVPDDGEDENG